METFFTGCRVENHIDRSKHFRLARLPVDTGSGFTWVPTSKLEGIGVEREKKAVRFVIANGEVITRSVAFAVLRVDKQFTIDEVVCDRALITRGDGLDFGHRGPGGNNVLSYGKDVVHLGVQQAQKTTSP